MKRSLQAIIVKILIDFPKQTIWQIIALSMYRTATRTAGYSRIVKAAVASNKYAQPTPSLPMWFPSPRESYKNLNPCCRPTSFVAGVHSGPSLLWSPSRVGQEPKSNQLRGRCTQNSSPPRFFVTDFVPTKANRLPVEKPLLML